MYFCAILLLQKISSNPTNTANHKQTKTTILLFIPTCTDFLFLAKNPHKQ